jgi:hypothetical protein
MAEASQNRPTNLIKNAVLSCPVLHLPSRRCGWKKTSADFISNDRVYRGKTASNACRQAKDLRPE